MSNQPVDQSEAERLEQRLRRLEEALAQVQDVHQIEDRVRQRLAQQLPIAMPVEGQYLQAGSRIVDESRRLLPPSPANLSARSLPEPVPALVLLKPLLILDMIAEIRCIVRMFVDPRYSLGWYPRLMPLALLAAILTSLIWIPGIHFMPDWVATVISKLVDLMLAYVMIRILSREARRYRETAPDLPPSLRL